jgi:hypothetical protein
LDEPDVDEPEVEVEGVIEGVELITGFAAVDAPFGPDVDVW